MEKLKKKLKSRAGETITETLVAVMIAALAMVMLAGAINAAAGVVAKSREKLSGQNGYYAKAEDLAKMTSGEDGTITITGAAPTLNQSVNIIYDVNTVFSESPVISYQTKTSE